MNILFITPSIPSRLHRIRSYDLIKAIAKRHNVHLLSLNSKGEVLPQELNKLVATYSIIHKPRWKSYIDCLVYLFSFLPLEVSYCRSIKMNKMVKEIIKKEKIDLIYVKRLRSYQFVQELREKIPIIIDTTDAMSLFYKRAYKNSTLFKKPLFLEEYFKYLLYERFLFKKNLNWVTCSKIDKDYLSNKFNNLNIEVIPNIVDINFFCSTYSKDSFIERHTLLFSGLMDKYVNIEGADFFVKKIFPIVLSKYPDSKLYIVGPNPVAHIKKYESKNIVVTGFVNDIRDYIKKVEVVVCPIITGTGVRNKILQAWAMEKPVISTTIGWQGLSGINGKELLLADKPEFFASCIINIFENRDLAKNLAINGKKLVESMYSELVISNSIDYLFNKTLDFLPNNVIITK